MTKKPPQMWVSVDRSEVEFRWHLFNGMPLEEAARRAFDAEPYSKDWFAYSKMDNGSQPIDCNPLNSLKNLAEWTGLEPATPGVTGRYLK